MVSIGLGLWVWLGFGLATNVEYCVVMYDHVCF